jgi:hypothetical protein
MNNQLSNQMNNQITEQNQLTTLLDEILLVPSKEIRADRFSAENQESTADCKPKCIGSSA